MSGADQVEGVQQQIADVVRQVSDLETALSAAKQAGDGDEVSFIRTQLEQLYKKEVALREKENLLLRAQQGGQAARPDKPASSFAEFLQSQAGKQQIAAGAGSVISLPLCVRLMGLSRYGRQLFVRPSYLQLKDRILQLRQASGTYDDKMMIISGTPGIGKSFCALYMASYWIAQGNRVIYEFHDQVEATSIIWYHFPPNSGEGIRILLERDVDHYVTGAADGDTVYIVDGGLPRIPASSCWCYAFSSPQKNVYRYERKVPSCHLMFLPLWTLQELQQCRGLVDIFSSTVKAELAELAFEFAGGLPRTVLQLPAQTANASIPIRSLVVRQLETAVNMLPSGALQDTVQQILTVGYHNGSDSLFHMSCHGMLERGHPTIVFATQFAAQLVCYKLGGVARYRQLAWFHGAAGHAHWHGARGYWFESLAHQVLANGGEHTFRLVGSDILYTLALPRATVFEFQVVQDLAGKFVADSMDVYAQPKYNNFPTFDSLNCGCLWFQVTVAKKHSDFMGGFKALQAAALPTCNLNNFVHPTLRDNSKPIHMIVTTPDRFETCYLKQKQSKGSLFQRGVMKLDLSSAFGQLQHKLGNSASGLENVEAMAIDSAVED
ncbi:TPA: hypothetical protein ACH3X2_005425 [Trebouxia sp. C0005]